MNEVETIFWDSELAEWGFDKRMEFWRLEGSRMFVPVPNISLHSWNWLWLVALLLSLMGGTDHESPQKLHSASSTSGRAWPVGMSHSSVVGYILSKSTGISCSCSDEPLVQMDYTSLSWCWAKAMSWLSIPKMQSSNCRSWQDVSKCILFSNNVFNTGSELGDKWQLALLTSWPRFYWFGHECKIDYRPLRVFVRALCAILHMRFSSNWHTS